MDALLIEQVILNIFENAMHHATGMTKLCLSVREDGEKAIFEITDDGCGIPKDRLEKIFMGYLDSAEHPADSRKRNAGIGLSVCATIIKAHGGNIYAQNNENGGASFRFILDIKE